MNHLKPKFLLVFFIATVATSALADGMMLSAPEMFIYENSQKAVIKYEAETSLETISILPGFTADADEFAWILPMPNLPQIEEGQYSLFEQLANFTRPQYNYRDVDCDGCGNGMVQADYEIGNPVEIVESHLVGYYQTMTLSSDEAPALVDSLTQWGFLHAGNIEEATGLINSYVEQDWYFITVKVDSASFHESHPYYEDYYDYNAYLDPLTFTFSSEKIIYPMRISSLSAAESTQVDLYVIADHRMTFPNSHTRYANKFDEDEISRITNYSFNLVRDLLEPGCVLTHLRQNFQPQDMTEDITLVPAETDDEYQIINYSGFPWMTLLLFGPAVCWGAYRKFRLSRYLK